MSLLLLTFAEHGAYLFKVTRTAKNDTKACSIVQIGESSHYWSPVIIGCVVWIVFIAIIQLCCYIHRNDYFNKFVTNVFNQRLIKDNYETIPLIKHLVLFENLRQTEHKSSQDEANERTTPSSVKSKRFQALYSSRGLALMLMVFLNYGGIFILLLFSCQICFAVYRWKLSFFRHAVWNELHVNDILFPWFVWLIGFSIVLSQQSLRAKKLRKRSILFKICRRTVILFLLGKNKIVVCCSTLSYSYSRLIGNGGTPMLETIKILGVLQRLALCYFFTSLIVLFVPDTNRQPNAARFAIGGNIKRHWHIDLFNSVLHFWLQWLCVLLITMAWLLITFFSMCPIVQQAFWVLVVTMYMARIRTARENKTTLFFFPRWMHSRSLGTLTAILLYYIGVQSAHSYVHSTSIRHVCIHWFILAIICGSLGLLLSKRGDFNGWIPINKNLWLLSFVLIVASIGFFVMIIFYLIVDIGQWLASASFVWLGMNSIFIYMASTIFSGNYPIQFGVERTHAKLMTMNLYGAFLWTLIAGYMYWKKFLL